MLEKVLHCLSIKWCGGGSRLPSPSASTVIWMLGSQARGQVEEFRPHQH